MKKLLAVFLGGYAPNCNVEVHDMVFVLGESIEDTFPQLVQKWFIKSYRQFHYDGYRDLSVVDGYRVVLSQEPSSQGAQKLFFVHLGAYDPEDFTELHKNCFLVAPDPVTAKSRAQKSWELAKVPHKDVQVEVESCLPIDTVDQYFIGLTPSTEEPNRDLHLGYNLIPKDIIARYVGTQDFNFRK